MTDRELRDAFEGDDPLVLRGEHSPGPPPRQALAALPVGGAVLIATSGSTGRPKWVVHARSTLRASARAVVAHLGIARGEGWLRALPWHHVAGLGVLVRAWEMDGPVSVLHGKWSPARLAGLLEASGAAWLSLVPTQVHDLVEAALRPPGSLRGAIVGGGALRPELAAAGRALGWPLLRSYGLSEAGTQVATELPGRIRADGALPLLPGWEVVPAVEGGPGKLRSAALAKGYLQQDEDGHWRFHPLADAEGWYQGSDSIELIEDGAGRALRLLGRVDDRIKILGVLVSLTALQGEVEALLQPGEDAALRARPDERTEHRLLLQTSGMEPDRAAELAAEFHRRVPRYVRIAAIEPVAGIPRSELGKLRRE